MSHELRTDVLTGRQVIVAPVRSERPGAFVPDPELSRGLDPFAEGQEHETPDEWFASRTADSIANKPGWSLRVVPNRYPLLTTEASATADEHGSALFPTALVPGVHDVVIECPDQRSRLAELSTAELANVLTAWRMRLSQLSTTGEYSSVVVFRNEGFSAGASLKHCHSQIVAMRSLTMIDQERMRHESVHRQEIGRAHV